MLRCKIQKLSVILAASIFFGCASFEPAMRYPDLLRPREPTVTAEQNGLKVSVEEFASPAKSKQAFDADLASNGILALLVRIDNNSDTTYKVRQIDINATQGGRPLATVYGDQAASEAGESEYVGKAAGWTLATGPFALFLWPITIAGSAAHTATVNRRIEQHFASMEFSDKVLKPKQSAAGFIYLKMPGKTKILDNLQVSVQPSEEGTDKRLQFNFSLPSLDLTTTNPSKENRG
jgi:hypothetical protein